MLPGFFFGTQVFTAGHLDNVNAAHPHMDDPRFLTITNQSNNCILRFTVFTRCARELGEEASLASGSNRSETVCEHRAVFPRWPILSQDSKGYTFRLQFFGSEEDTRCKYQYYRAQCTCPESQLEDWMEHRARGSCHLDVLPDRSTVHVKQ